MFYCDCITVSSSLHLFVVLDEWAGHSQGWAGVSFTVMGRWLASQVNRRITEKNEEKKSKRTQDTVAPSLICTHIKSYAIKPPGTHTDTPGRACADCGGGV